MVPAYIASLYLHTSGAVMLTGVVQLAPGAFHTMLVKQDGSVWSTAITSRGLVPSRGLKNTFVEVFPSGARTAAAGTDFSIVLNSNDQVWGMGQNSKGQLGDGTRINKDKFANNQRDKLVRCFIRIR